LTLLNQAVRDRFVGRLQCQGDVCGPGRMQLRQLTHQHGARNFSQCAATYAIGHRKEVWVSAHITVLV
jgi:hypothetical protein